MVKMLRCLFTLYISECNLNTLALFEKFFITFFLPFISSLLALWNSTRYRCRYGIVSHGLLFTYYLKQQFAGTDAGESPLTDGTVPCISHSTYLPSPHSTENGAAASPKYALWEPAIQVVKNKCLDAFFAAFLQALFNKIF